MNIEKDEEARLNSTLDTPSHTSRLEKNVPEKNVLENNVPEKNVLENNVLENNVLENKIILEQIAALRKENELLLKRVAELTNASEELYTYKVFTNARDKFVQWVLMITVILGAFGLVSISSIIEEIRDQTATKVTEKLVPKIEQQVLEQTSAKAQEIRDKIVQDVTNSVEKEILESARSQVDEMLSNFKNMLEKQENELVKQRESLSTQQESIARLESQIDSSVAQPQVLENQIETQTYLVVAGSSTVKTDVEREKERVGGIIGNDRLNSQYQARVCSPKGGNQRYALVLGQPSNLEDAQTLVQRAIEAGFQKDTYPIRVSSAFFDPDECD